MPLRYLITGSLVILALLWGNVAMAADRVVLLIPDEPSALVAEASVRLAAELRASGFVVVRHQLSSWDSGDTPEFVGQVQLMEDEAYVEIRTRAMADRSPVLQRADPRDSQTSAEVIAIRAVESLRAVLLQALQNGALEERELTPTVRQFTSFAPPPPPKEEKPPPPPPPPQPAETTPSRSTERSGLSAALALAPSVTALGAEGAVGGGLEGRALMGYRGASVGLVAEGSLVPASTSSEAGTVKMRHFSLLLVPGLKARFSKHWELGLALALGLHQIQLDAEASEGFTGDEAPHYSMVFQGDLSGGYFWKTGLGLFAFARAGGLLNAPVILVDGEETRYGRPLINAGLGMAWRIPSLSE